MKSFRRDLGLDLGKSTNEAAERFGSPSASIISKASSTTRRPIRILAKLLAETDNTHHAGGNYLF